jgi:hypothetical protein
MLHLIGVVQLRALLVARLRFEPGINFDGRAGIFKQSMGARNRVGIGYRTGPPGYIGWRKSFLGIDSSAP